MQAKRSAKANMSSLEDWGTDEVIDWLGAVDPALKEKYASSFRNEAVNGTMLAMLDSFTLVELGVVGRPHRKRILKAVDELVVSQYKKVKREDDASIPSEVHCTVLKSAEPQGIGAAKDVVEKEPDTKNDGNRKKESCTIESENEASFRRQPSKPSCKLTN